VQQSGYLLDDFFEEWVNQNPSYLKRGRSAHGHQIAKNERNVGSPREEEWRISP